jgi:DNA-binding response OmpR family regulator
MKEVNILWVDDEIDLLKVHILFLQEKGHKVLTSNNGFDALNLVKENNFDIIFLDENMPGMNGLEVLSQIKEINLNIPVVMVTKNEEEDIMDEAIGSKIADYLIKPVNPKQILLAIKKNVENKRLITEKTNLKYQTEFSKLGFQINQTRTFEDWVDVYKKLVFWEIELTKSQDNAMDEVLMLQKTEANNAFAKYVKTNYLNWFKISEDQRPKFQTDVFKKNIFPLLDNGEKVLLIVIDNLRFDQWKTLQPIIREYLTLDNEELMCSILPTATQYARNAMFSGLMPAQIEQMFPDLWSYDDEEGGKNEHEEELLKTLFERYRKKVDFHFEKVFQNRQGTKILENLKNILNNQLIVIVYNFVDMLSHARTEMQMIKELAQDEAAYRSLTLTWFEHSALLDLIKEISNHKIKVIITTDHGAVKVQDPIKVVGDRNTTTNLRYKQGKNLNYNHKEVFEITKPEQAGLPSSNLSSTYIFTTNRDFFAYPNNYNHYVKYYKDTFQHGGISLEEMLIPLLTFSSKK